MAAELRYRPANGAQQLASLNLDPSSSQAMAHPMLRGVTMAIIGDAAVRAVSAGVVGVAAVGETAAQLRNLCEKRFREQRPPTTPRERPPAPAESLSIHSNPSDGEIHAGGAQASTTTTTAQPEAGGSPASKAKWTKSLASGSAPMDLAITVPTADPTTIAQLVPTTDQTKGYLGDRKADNIIQQQLGDISKLPCIFDTLTNKIDMVMAENLDLRQHMDKDLETAEKKLEATYNNRLICNTERKLGENNSEIRLLQLQLAKYNKRDDVEEPDTMGNQKTIKSDASEIRRELEFLDSAWQQSSEQFQRAQKRTLQACPNGLLQYHIGSQDSMLAEDKYTDEQAYLIIQQTIQDKDFVLLNGNHMYVSDAFKDIGKPQRQRILDKINAQKQTPLNERVNEKDFEKLFEELEEDCAIGKQARGGLPTETNSQADSTPPRQHTISPHNNGDDGDDGDGEDFMLSVIPEIEKGGGDGGGGDNGGQGTNGSREDGKGNGKDNSEFTLVNSRNTEMKQFTGELICKMTCLEFNAMTASES